MLEQIEARSEELTDLGTRGISTEAIESLLSDIMTAQYAPECADQASQDRLEELSYSWRVKLAYLESYLCG
jgi:hypothetical protein